MLSRSRRAWECSIPAAESAYDAGQLRRDDRYLAVVQEMGTVEIMDTQGLCHIVNDSSDIPIELTFDTGDPARSARTFDGKLAKHGRVQLFG